MDSMILALLTTNITRAEEEELLNELEEIYGIHFVELMKRILKKTIAIFYGTIKNITDVIIHDFTPSSSCVLINTVLYGKTFENVLPNIENNFQVIYSYFIGYDSITITNPTEFSGNKFYDCKIVVIDMPREVNSFNVNFHFENCANVTINCNNSSEKPSVTEINSNIKLIGFSDI
jgi:hypothetical protein